MILAGKRYPNVGDRFDRLTVIGVPFYVRNGKQMVKLVVCECECGKIIVTRVSLLLRKETRSCRCLGQTHGLSGHANRHPLYMLWDAMRSRCRNPKNIAYKNYGGRGISVCSEWDGDFMVFFMWAQENGWQPGLQIDRIDNDGNYEPKNCRFVSQATNKRKTRNTVLLTAFGESKCLAEWGRDPRCAVSPSTVSFRLRSGMSPEDAIATASRIDRELKGHADGEHS